MTETARIAIIGAGPTGFFLAERLLSQTAVPVSVDLFEQLPAPYGLVRYGVAPDHEKIRQVTRAFDRTAGRAGFRYFGNVAIGRDLRLDELSGFYHQICVTTGAADDRRMGVPGEDLRHSHAATEFVAWYNGHPAYRDHTFHLDAERVAVVGVGNVAVDVARILCRTPDELATTDIADYALDALSRSRVRDVTLLGRRGPAQAAFTTPEVRELGELAGADVTAREEEVALDPLSQAEVDRADDAALVRKIEVLQEFARHPPTGKPRRLTLRFLVSPTEVLGDAHGAVRGLRLARNRLVARPDGSLAAEATGEEEELPIDLLFRSVGYRGRAMPGLPFDERRGIIPNAAGRVSGEDGPRNGFYVAGWIKRGPSGVIGTNKPCAVETATAMLEDWQAGRHLAPSCADPSAVDRCLQAGGVRWVTYPEWARLRTLEEEAGKAAGRPRIKLTTVEEMLSVISDQ